MGMWISITTRAFSQASPHDGSPPPTALTMYRLARPLLFALPPERAHAAALALLQVAYRSGLSALLAERPAQLPTHAFGLTFPNPVGLAAGLDKNGAHIDALFALGFGFVEVGTVTPRAQLGNPAPRLFRLAEANAIINRMGFNNHGVHALLRHLECTRVPRGILGINIGKNKDTPNERAQEDYVDCLEQVYAHADYVTINISSPNTAGLRELQEEQALCKLLEAIGQARARLSQLHARHVPILVKISPDLNEDDINAAARVLNNAKVEGVIATNTTVARNAVERHRYACEPGGLSGAPLMDRSTTVLRMLRTRLDDTIPLIGVGGIMRGADAAQKTAAGADLVQLYTGLVYRGPTLIGECVEAIRRRKEAPSRGSLQLA